MDIKFCNEHSIKAQIIELVRSLIFNISQEKVEKIYSMFRDVYNKELNPDDLTYRQLIEIPLSEIKMPVSKMPPLNNFEIYDTDTHIGVDFPTWFNFSDDKPMIMLVGIDPLRSEDYWKDLISIGTPYDIHRLRNLNKNLESNLFWKLISGLAKDYSIYVTDTFKVFFLEEGDMKRRSYNCKRFTNPSEKKWQDEIHQKIFLKEIDIIKPVAIITLGRKPVQWFTSLKTESFKELKVMIETKDEKLLRCGIPVLPFSHLSDRATTYGQKLYGVPSKNDLPDKYISIIKSYLETSKNKL